MKKRQRGIFKKSWLGIIAAVTLLSISAPEYVEADGLAYQHLLTQRWRDLFYRHSPVINPAFMTEEDYKTARMVFAPTAGMEFNLFEAGYTHPIGLYQSAGFSWLMFGSGPIDKIESGLTSGSDIAQQDHAFSFSYAINSWRRLSVGANVNVILQTLFDEPLAYGAGIDLGGSYRVLQHPLFGYHIGGVMLQNALAPNLTGNPADAFSRNVKLSWMVQLFEDRIESGIDVNIMDFLSQADLFREAGSSGEMVDAAKKIEWEANYRLGVWFLRAFKLYWLTGWGETNLDWGLAGGVNVPSLNSGRDIEMLYQFNTLAGSDLASHSLYARAEVGRHREEIFARKMAQQLAASPNKLYIRAMNLYTNEQYWDALFVFGELASRFPDFFKNDWVSYYMRSCQEELDMREAAQEGYREMTDEYPKSEAVDYANLGIMRIAYKQGSHPTVTEQFSKMNQQEVPDSLKHHAYYIMGQSHMRKENLRKAIQLFEEIPADHPAYVFAQHSLGISNIRLDNMETGQAAFGRCVSADVATPAQREIQNRTYVLLGYMFYENGKLSNAIASLRKVEPSSYYYEDALLGQAWTSLKAKQYSDCRTSCDELIARSDKEVLIAEALLIKGYVNMLQGSYPRALDVLTKAQGIASKAQRPSSDSLSSRKETYKKKREVYDSIATQAYILSKERKTSIIYNMIDSLGQRQINVKNDIDRYLDYADEYERKSFFARDLGRIRDDIEYAIAYGKQMVSEKEERKLQEKAEEKQEKLDEQIEEIRRQLQQEQEGDGE